MKNYTTLHPRCFDRRRKEYKLFCSVMQEVTKRKKELGAPSLTKAIEAKEGDIILFCTEDINMYHEFQDHALRVVKREPDILGSVLFVETSSLFHYLVPLDVFQPDHYFVVDKNFPCHHQVLTTLLRHPFTDAIENLFPRPIFSIESMTSL